MAIGFQRCINVLHRDFNLQYFCAIMQIGYARVSTGEQDNKAQILALEKAGCELIFQEKITGSRWERPELHKLLNQLWKKDVVVVWKLDRLSRSLKDVLCSWRRYNNRGQGFAA
jgi:DNA invertase Pin-like site-specific DNA recombinase